MHSLSVGLIPGNICSNIPLMRLPHDLRVYSHLTFGQNLMGDCNLGGGGVMSFSIDACKLTYIIHVWVFGDGGGEGHKFIFW